MVLGRGNARYFCYFSSHYVDLYCILCAIFRSSATYCTSKNTASGLTKRAAACTQATEGGKPHYWKADSKPFLRLKQSVSAFLSVRLERFGELNYSLLIFKVRECMQIYIYGLRIEKSATLSVSFSQHRASKIRYPRLLRILR